MEKVLRRHAEKVRYVLVGGFNTALDFCLLFIFVALGVDKIVANFFSTGVSMVVSFFANKTYTFKDDSANHKRQFILFIAVTIVGMWVVQPIIIWSITGTLHIFIANQTVLLFVAKVIATGASMIWNYFMYSRLVFKKQ